MITHAIKDKIMAIVNVFETGTPEGRYDAVVVLPDGRNGSRQITYGRSQTTEQGNLRNLLERYISLGGKFAGEFMAFMPKVGTVPLADNKGFKDLLKRSAKEDPLMRRAQDETFEILYFQPALHFFTAEQFAVPLSLLVIYDSYIHSGSIPLSCAHVSPNAHRCAAATKGPGSWLIQKSGRTGSPRIKEKCCIPPFTAPKLSSTR